MRVRARKLVNCRGCYGRRVEDSVNCGGRTVEGSIGSAVAAVADDDSSWNCCHRDGCCRCKLFLSSH